MALDARSPLEFVVMENVPTIMGQRGRGRLEEAISRLRSAGFAVEKPILDAANFHVPQHRRRLFLIAIKQVDKTAISWVKPALAKRQLTVRDTLANLPEPKIFERGSDPKNNPVHENHWVHELLGLRNFLMGHCKRVMLKSAASRHSGGTTETILLAIGTARFIFILQDSGDLAHSEALLLQGFPKSFILDGSMSSQITQVSEAVPPPLANAVAESCARKLSKGLTQQQHRLLQVAKYLARHRNQPPGHQHHTQLVAKAPSFHQSFQL